MTCSGLCAAWRPRPRPGKYGELVPSLPGEGAEKGVWSLSSYCVLGFLCFQAATRGIRWYHPIYQTKARKGQETSLSQHPTNKGPGLSPQPMPFS